MPPIIAEVKDFFRKIPIVTRANAALKNVQFNRRLAQLDAHYASRAPKPTYPPDVLPPADLKTLRASWTRNVGSGPIRLLVVGTMEAQDRSGMLQALQRLTPQATIFTKADGGYGLEFPAALSDAGPRDRNSARLSEIWSQLKKNGETPNLVIGQMMGLVVAPETLDAARRDGAVVVNISMDDRLPELWLPAGGANRVGAIALAPHVDLTLTTCGDRVPWYRSEGTPALFTTLASDPQIMHPAAQRDVGISFVGNKYGERARLMAAVQSAGIPIEIYGRGWPNGPVDASTGAAINSRSKVIVGCGTVSHSKTVFTLKLRDFDALMAGGCYVTHRNPDLLRIFTEGEDLLCYESPEELVAQLRYCLDNPERAAEIARNGHAKAMRDHTWDKLFSNLLQMMTGKEAT